MSNTADSNHDDEAQNHEPKPHGESDPSTGSDGEFKVTIRKLELPVRPRGVLAE